MNAPQTDDDTDWFRWSGHAPGAPSLGPIADATIGDTTGSMNSFC